MDAKELVPLLAQGALCLIIASIGLQARWRDVLAAMRNTDLLLKGLLAVNIVVPIAALVICSILPIHPLVRIGIVIMAVSPMAPLVQMKMWKGGLDTSAAIGLYIALILSAILFVPATVALLSALYPTHASISVAAVARMVAITTLLPVAVGLAISNWAPDLARRAAPVVMVIGFIAILLLAVLILYKQGGAMLGLLGDGTLLAIMVTVAIGIAAGNLLGRPSPANSNALAMAAGTRHPGIAALIVHANFNEPRVMLTVLLFLLTGVIMTLAFLLWQTKRAHGGPSGPSGASGA
jgi:BASS family bile acid:Na+ symporter